MYDGSLSLFIVTIKEKIFSFLRVIGPIDSRECFDFKWCFCKTDQRKEIKVEYAANGSFFYISLYSNLVIFEGVGERFWYNFLF